MPLPKRTSWTAACSWALVAATALVTDCTPAAPSRPSAPLASHPILVLTTVDFEFDAVTSAIQGRRAAALLDRSVASGVVDGVPVVVVRAGWGKAQAAGATAAAIARYAPSAVVMAGVGGAIDPARATSGDVVLVSETYQYDLGHLADGGFGRWTPETPHETDYTPKKRFLASSALVNYVTPALAGLPLESWSVQSGCTCDNHGKPQGGCTGTPLTIGRAHPRVCIGVDATGDTFLEDRDAARPLLDPDTAVVDMETAAVAEEARNAGLPFLGIRVVADALSYNVYFCLKPAAGLRLAEVARRVLPALAEARATGTAPLARCDPTR